MSKADVSSFNNVVKRLIKKSLFTERQIEIILKQRDLRPAKFPITRGAYYRQVCQSRQKLAGLLYSVALLQGLGVLVPGDIDVISTLSEQIDVINSSDIFPEREDDIINVIDRLVKQACRM